MVNRLSIKLDKSCLENFHLAEAFKLTNKPGLDIFKKLSSNDFKLFRKRVIEAVIATDMMNHSKLIGIMTARLFVMLCENKRMTLTEMIEENKELNKFDVQQDYINFTLHAIDIGHAAKPFNLELKWAELVTQEFHNQGDKEKELGLPISFLCDRSTANLPSNQVGFIAGIVLPTFNLAHRLLPSISEYINLIKQSKEEWEKLKK